MTWFKVDDHLADHRKVRRLGKDRMAAIGLWTLCGSWAGSNLSDGFVPETVVERFDPHRRMAARLVEVGLWEPAAEDGEPGFRFHEWAEHQPMRAEVESERAAARERMRKGRAAKRGASGAQAPSLTVVS